ncbi:MAG TPA: energy transducer TonB [Pyrinomonadaceae bacterium]|jgi:hypothetical protein|nr:energy transducer TonB [Pyrinomonadaceae bacterium]
MKAILFTLAFLCLSGIAPTHAAPTPAAQETAADELKRLREQAKQSKADPEPWREYAEALDRSGDRQEAVKAFAEAVERYVNLYGNPAPFRGQVVSKEEAARNRADRAAQLRRAPETIERFIQLGGAPAGFEREQLEAFAAQARLLNEADAKRTVFNAADLDRKARILDKPAPDFTDAGATGVVRLRAVLAADGKVKHVYVQRGVSRAMAEAGVKAARRIRFEPAVKDGKPVSQFIVLEYSFNTYVRGPIR